MFETEGDSVCSPNHPKSVRTLTWAGAVFVITTRERSRDPRSDGWMDLHSRDRAMNESSPHTDTSFVVVSILVRPTSHSVCECEREGKKKTDFLFSSFSFYVLTELD